MICVPHLGGGSGLNLFNETTFVSSEPLPVRSAHISDYKEAPETGVVFDIDPPSRTVFSRVNISFTEGQERRSMLYKGQLSESEPDFCFRPGIQKGSELGFEGSVSLRAPKTPPVQGPPCFGYQSSWNAKLLSRWVDPSCETCGAPWACCHGDLVLISSEMENLQVR